MWDIAERTLVNAAVSQVTDSLFGNISQREALELSNQKTTAANMTSGQATAIGELGTTMARVDDVSALFSVDPDSANNLMLDLVKDLKEYETGNYSWYDSTMPNEKGQPTLRAGQDRGVARAANQSLDMLYAKMPLLNMQGKNVKEYEALQGSMALLETGINSGDYRRSKELKDLVDRAQKNFIEKGKLHMPATGIKTELDEMKKFKQAASMAYELDADPKTLGLQLHMDREDIGTKFVNFGNDPEDISYAKSLYQDLRKNKIVGEWKGQTNITYQDAAKMVDIYFRAEEHGKASQLMDKLVPDSKGIKNKAELMAIQAALTKQGLDGGTKVAARMQKTMAVLKSSIDTTQGMQIHQANELGVKSNANRADLFSDAKQIYGLPISHVGSIETAGEEEIQGWHNLWGTGEFENPMSQSTKELFGSYFSEWSPIPKATSTEGNIIRTRRNIKHKRLVDSGKDIMRIFAAGASEGTGEDDNILVWVRQDLVKDGDGYKYKQIFESRTFDQIENLTDDQVLNTLSSSDRKGGLSWALGVNLPEEMSIEDRNAEAIKRVNGLYMGDDSGFWTGTERFTNFTTQALEGSEGRLIQSMGRHWIGEYADYTNLVNTQKMTDGQDVQMDEWRQLILAGNQNIAYVLSPEMMAMYDNIKAGIGLDEAGAGGSETKTGDDIPIISNILKGGVDAVDVALGKKGITAPGIGDTTSIALQDKSAALLAEADKIRRDGAQIEEDAASGPIMSGLGASLTNLDITSLGKSVVPDYGKTSGELENMALDTPVSQYPQSVVDQEPTQKQDTNRVLDSLDVQSIVPKGDRHEFKSVRDGYGKQMTSAERGQFSKDGIVPDRLVDFHNKDMLIKYLTRLEKLKWTETNMPSESVSSEREALEQEIRDRLGQHIDPSTGSLSNDTANKEMYDLLARAFPNKSITELQEMVRKYSTLEDYASRK